MRRRLDGALLLDKPVGLSSNAALQRAKRIFGAQKAGHAGTLDPLASGLLLVVFGEATKFAGPLLEADKEYLATLKLGETTATGDAEGEVLQRRPAEVSDAALKAALERFRGEIDQIPPMYSALKSGGVPLYTLARRGQTIERPARRVRITTLELLAHAGERVELRVRCTKGTYIRTLAEDIGETLGTGAHLTGLRRTASGGFRVESAASLEALESLHEQGRDDLLLPLPALIADLPQAHLDAAGEARFRNGQALAMPGLADGVYGVYGPGGSVIGLGSCEAGGLRPTRLTATLQEAEKAR
jgi:tRNA pseudouridine55 synthase